MNHLNDRDRNIAKSYKSRLNWISNLCATTMIFNNCPKKLYHNDSITNDRNKEGSKSGLFDNHSMSSEEGNRTDKYGIHIL